MDFIQTNDEQIGQIELILSTNLRRTVGRMRSTRIIRFEAFGNACASIVDCAKSHDALLTQASSAIEQNV